MPGKVVDGVRLPAVSRHEPLHSNQVTVPTHTTFRRTHHAMKFLPPCAILIGVTAFLPLHAEETPSAEESWNVGWRLTSDYSLKEPFDPEELRRLASDPDSDDRRLMLLILRAGIEKDNAFEDLLKKPELRKHANVDLALSAYDYMLNRSEAALDHILASLAAEDIGSDSNAIVVLQPLDEWDRSIRAFRKHFIHTDGAGGSCKVGFMTTRAYLYPKEYAEMRDAIEAPIVWSAPLLPGK